jgi:hypothetical protein
MTNRSTITAFVALLLSLICSPIWAQGTSAQQPVLTQVALWGVPRAQWGDMDKANADNKAILDPLVADGTLLGYGMFENRIHSDGGYTHGSWFKAASIANLMKALEKFYSRPANVTTPVQAASKHIDYIMISTIHGARSTP